MSEAFQRLRTSLSLAADLPVVAVRTDDVDHARRVRDGGGLPLPSSPGELSEDRVIWFALDSVSDDHVSDLKAAHGDALIIDAGRPNSSESAATWAGQGVDGIAVGMMGYDGGAGSPVDRTVAYALEEAFPVVCGEMNGVRALGFFENLGHTDVLVIADDASEKNIEAIQQAARCRSEGGDVFQALRAGGALRDAFHRAPADADALYPGWRAA